MTTVTDDLIEQLKELDTPTICNALESVVPQRRGYGYTTDPLICTRPELGSMVGYARTACIRAMHPSDVRGEALAICSMVTTNTLMTVRNLQSL